MNLHGAHASSSKIVESLHPPYVASVSGDVLTRIDLSPLSLKLDMNARNSIRSETGDYKPARYSFPDAHVSRALLHRLSDVYQYDRRRDVPIVSSGGDWVIAEYLRAGSHVPVCRFELLGEKVLRQEQLDPTGRVNRIIVIGWAPASAKEDDAQVDSLALGEHPAWIRVFDVSRSGTKRLVALAWRKTPSATAPAEPKGDELAFGPSAGIVKWRDKAAFLKAWNIDADARCLSGKPAHPKR